MKDSKYGFIYITTNLINGKRYIGQKKYNHYWKTYLGSGVIFQRAVKKYGKENFRRDIIEECETKEQLDEREIYWISYYNATENDEFYNINSGGYINDRNGYDEKTQRELCVKTGSNHGISKRVICLNTLEIFDCIQYAVDKYGCNRSSIRKCCTGEIHRTKSNNNEWITWMWYEDYLNTNDAVIKNKLKKVNDGMKGENNPFYNKKHTTQTKNKLSKNKKGKSNELHYKSVICLTTNKIFQSLKEAKEYYNLKSNIVDACKGKSHYSGEYNGLKLVWMYYDEYLYNQEEVKKRLEYINFKPRTTSRKVRCLNTGEIFDSITLASNWCLQGSNISECCKGKLKTAGKHPITDERLKWEYVDL